MDAYSAGGAEEYSAEGDGAEAAPADYNGMNYAAATAETGGSSGASDGIAVMSENEAAADHQPDHQRGQRRADLHYPVKAPRKQVTRRRKVRKQKIVVN